MNREKGADIVPVILAGGAGRRLWPLSRAGRPKPFIRLPRQGGLSLFQATLRRAEYYEPPLIVASAAHQALVQAHLSQSGIRPERVLLEPHGRNTGPAVAVAAHYLAQLAPDSLMLVLPSDHVIIKPELLQQAIRQGAQAAQQGRLVLFGITPSRPASCYGYIQADGENEVIAFHEKPPSAQARAYLQQGGYYWNSGMFLFRPAAFLEVLYTHEPVMHEAALSALNRAAGRQDTMLLREQDFENCPARSVDKAVMEKTGNLALVPVDPGWSDLGSWRALGSFLLRG